MTPKSSQYIDGKRMCRLAAEAAKARVLSDELVEMFYALARRTLNTDQHSICRRFGYLDADDVVQEAVMRCFLVTLNFDETKLKHQHDAYFFFRVIIIQTYLRLHRWHSRQKRTPEHGIISISTIVATAGTVEGVQDRLDRCNRREYLGGDYSAVGDDTDYYEFAEEAITEIRRQCNNGATLDEIAKEYDVAVETVSKLLNRN